MNLNQAVWLIMGANVGTTVTVTKGDKSVNALKLMGLMSMAVKQGETVTVTIEGENEDQVCAELEQFFKENF